MQTRSTIRRASNARSASAAAAVLLACLGAAACTPATQTDNPLRGAAATVGWATTVPEPKDFVRASRPRGELAYVPIGRGGEARAVQARTPQGLRDLESELDRTRDAREAQARRALPRGAYGQALPSVARPASAGGSPETFPVTPNRLRQMRDNARDATDTPR